MQTTKFSKMSYVNAWAYMNSTQKATENQLEISEQVFLQ